MFFCNKLHHFKCIKESSESKESIEMVGWHHRLNGHGFGWTLEVADGWGGLACCSSWGCKELDMTERLNWTELSNDLSNSSNKSSVSHLYLKKKKNFLHQVYFKQSTESQVKAILQMSNLRTHNSRPVPLWNWSEFCRSPWKPETKRCDFWFSLADTGCI